MKIKDKLIDAVTTIMTGRKCDCVGCNCHYNREDAQKVIEGIAPLIIKAVTHDTHDLLIEEFK